MRCQHQAYNLLTGEIIGTDNSGNLKRTLKLFRRLHRPGKWIFSHEGEQGITRKLVEKGLIKG